LATPPNWEEYLSNQRKPKYLKQGHQQYSTKSNSKVHINKAKATMWPAQTVGISWSHWSVWFRSVIPCSKTTKIFCT